MLPLKELQSLFLNAVYGSADKIPASERQRFYPLIHATAKLSAPERLEIYRHSILTNMAQALASTYPVCKKIVGDDNFYFLAKHYINRYPSQTQNLNYYGEHFAELITELSRDIADLQNEFKFLPDLARLEWYWDHALYAQDDEPFNIAALAEISAARQGDIIFGLSHSAQCLASAYPLLTLWQKHQTELNRETAAADVSNEKGVHLLVWRRHYERRIDVVPASEWPFLLALAQCQRFAAICATIDVQACDVIKLLPQFVQRGWITSFQLAA